MKHMRNLAAVLLAALIFGTPTALAAGSPPDDGGKAEAVSKIVTSCQFVAVFVDPQYIGASLNYMVQLPDGTQSPPYSEWSPVAGGLSMFGLPFASGDGGHLVFATISLYSFDQTISVELGPLFANCGTSTLPTDFGFPPGFGLGAMPDFPIYRMGYCTPNGRYVNLLVGQDQSPDVDPESNPPKAFRDEQLQPAYVDPVTGVSSCAYPSLPAMPDGMDLGAATGPQPTLVKTIVIHVCGMVKKAGKWHYVFCKKAKAKPAKAKR
jgi:hypothetical protein